MLRLPLRGNNTLHFFTFSLATTMGTKPFLDKFQSLFVFSYAQHFHAPSFIRCKPCNFPDQVTNKFNSFVADPLSSRGFWLHRILCDFVSFLEANGHLQLWRRHGFLFLTMKTKIFLIFQEHKSANCIIILELFLSARRTHETSNGMIYHNT